MIQTTETDLFQTRVEIEDKVKSFISKELPVQKWTHVAHLTVTIWHLLKYTKAETVCLLRPRIIIYNESVYTKNSSVSGYHETITLFWIWVIDNYLKRNSGPITELTYSFLKSKYADKHLPLKFYSKKHLFTVHSRALWTEPDIMELDYEKI